MQSTASTVSQYIDELPEDRRSAMQALREEILSNLPGGFEETMSYGGIGYVVPHSLYPAGYHCDPKLPLPFFGIASQKHFIGVYHMGIYADPELMKWFLEEYPKHSSAKLDMGKSCIRFKKVQNIPMGLIGELAAKTTVERWVTLYEKNLKR